MLKHDANMYLALLLSQLGQHTKAEPALLRFGFTRALAPLRGPVAGVHEVEVFVFQVVQIRLVVAPVEELVGPILLLVGSH